MRALPTRRKKQSGQTTTAHSDNDTADAGVDTDDATRTTSASKSLTNATRDEQCRRVILLGSLSNFFVMMAFSMTLPFYQDRFDAVSCDELCRGSLTSMRSALSLVGSAVVGRASDILGRKPMLYLSMAAHFMSTAIWLLKPDLTGLWMSTVPAAAFNHNSSVTKALIASEVAFTQQQQEQKVTSSTEADGMPTKNSTDETQDQIVDDKPTDSSSNINSSSKSNDKKEKSLAQVALGRQGMFTGFAFMVGPAIGAMSVKSFESALWLGMVSVSISVVLVMFIQNHELTDDEEDEEDISDKQQHQQSTITNDDSSPSSTKISKSRARSASSGSGRSKSKPATGLQGLIRTFLSMPKESIKGVKLIMFVRLCMALAYHVFNILWSGALKNKFGLGPKGQAAYIGLMGLCYALSQGFIATPMVRALGGSRKSLLVCVVTLVCGRWVAIWAPNVAIVFVSGSIVIIALGVMNTLINESCTHLADEKTIGGVFGLVQAVEDGAGLIGPAIGGLVATQGEFATLMTVSLLYGCVLVAVWWLYDELVTKLHVGQSANVGSGKMHSE